MDTSREQVCVTHITLVLSPWDPSEINWTRCSMWHVAGGILTMTCTCWQCHQGSASLTTLLGTMGSPPSTSSKSAVTPLGFYFRKANWYTLLALLLHEGVLEVQLTARHSGNPLPSLPGYCLLAAVLSCPRLAPKAVKGTLSLPLKDSKTWELCSLDKTGALG